MKLTFTILRYLGIYFVSLVLIIFAVTKFMDTQFQIFKYHAYIPLKDLTPFWHAWTFFGYSYAYGVFLGLAELTAGVLILFDRTRLVALLLALCIYVNIVIIDYEFKIWGPLVHASAELLIVILLLTSYVKDLKKFFWDMGGRFTAVAKDNKWFGLIIPTSFATIVTTGCFIMFFVVSSDQDEIMGEYELTEVILDGDTLALTAGKYTREPYLFFEMGKTCIFSTDGDSHFGIYSTAGDSIKIQIYGDFHRIDYIEGIIDRKQNIITGLADDKPFTMKMKRIPTAP